MERFTRGLWAKYSDHSRFLYWLHAVISFHDFVFTLGFYGTMVNGNDLNPSRVCLQSHSLSVGEDKYLLPSVTNHFLKGLTFWFSCANSYGQKGIRKIRLGGKLVHKLSCVYAKFHLIRTIFRVIGWVPHDLIRLSTFCFWIFQIYTGRRCRKHFCNKFDQLKPNA